MQLSRGDICYCHFGNTFRDNMFLPGSVVSPSPYTLAPLLLSQFPNVLHISHIVHARYTEEVRSTRRLAVAVSTAL